MIAQPIRAVISGEMVSILAVGAAIAITVAVAAADALPLGVVLLAIGSLPVVFFLQERGGPAVRGVVPLHVGSFLAQTGLITVVIALIPG